jgi:hypothetical protein
MGSTLLRVYRANDAHIERETALTVPVFPQWITAHIRTPLLIKYHSDHIFLLCARLVGFRFGAKID